MPLVQGTNLASVPEAPLGARRHGRHRHTDRGGARVQPRARGVVHRDIKPEFGFWFLLIAIILNVSNSRRLTRYTPWVAGFLIASYISIELPFSGMSMNPARTI